MDWLQKRCETATEERDVMIMYTVDGSSQIDEQTLDHLEGYQGAKPGGSATAPRPAAARRLRRDHGLGVPLQQGGADLL